jgi:alpha-tubulin suppressor-like RCC1 family protein
MKTTLIVGIAAIAFASAAQAQQGCAAPFIGWGNLGQSLPPQGNCMGIAAGQGFVVQLQLDGSLTASGTISQPPQGQFLAVAGGFGHAAAIRADRRVVAWGLNHYGQTNVPGQLPDAAKVTTTYDNSAIIDVNGQIHVWGWTNFGLTNPPTGTFVEIDGGEFHLVALRSDGQTVCWGNNGHGQTAVPVGLGPCIAVAAGGGIVGTVATGHTLAVTAYGQVRAWGYNYYGQCNVPNGLANVVSVAAGGPHSIALKQDGTVVCWGDNRAGQSSPPTALGPVGMIVAGEFLSYAVQQCCNGDLNADHVINGSDLGILLAFWGSVTTFPKADLNGDSQVTGADLGMLLANWGPCSN